MENHVLQKGSAKTFASLTVQKVQSEAPSSALLLLSSRGKLSYRVSNSLTRPSPARTHKSRKKLHRTINNNWFTSTFIESDSSSYCPLGGALG